MERLRQARLSLAKQAWIKNIMEIQGYTRQKAEELFEKIKPTLY
jgi:hypothetical protein